VPLLPCAPAIPFHFHPLILFPILSAAQHHPQPVMPPNGGIIAKSRKPQKDMGSCRTMHPRPPFSLCSFWPYSLLFFLRLLPVSSFPRWRHRREMKCTFCISSMSCAVVAAAGTPVALHPPACLLLLATVPGRLGSGTVLADCRVDAW
jgi:hypothetical protein